jgi:hypothetical protein
LAGNQKGSSQTEGKQDSKHKEDFFHLFAPESVPAAFRGAAAGSVGKKRKINPNRIRLEMPDFETDPAVALIISERGTRVNSRRAKFPENASNSVAAQKKSKKSNYLVACGDSVEPSVRNRRNEGAFSPEGASGPSMSRLRAKGP